MSQNRRYASRLRQARLQKYLLFGLCALMLLVLLILGIRAATSRASTDDTKAPAEGGINVTQSAPPLEGDEDGDEDPLDPAEAEATAPDATLRPGFSDAADPNVKLLPIIYRKKDVKQKKVAITVDDCFSETYMRKIIKLAKKHGADLTFFPKGKTIADNAQLWRDIYKAGYEIENHSFPHSNVSNLDDEQLRAAIVDSEKALNEALGVNYHMRLFRCPTGAGTKDTRLHTLLKSFGYQAIASWGLSGTRDAKDTLSRVQPGQLLLFHATEADYNRLKVVIPGLVSKGYKMVSVNDLYDKGPNEVTDLATYDRG